jgi:enterobactin synthetase component D
VLRSSERFALAHGACVVVEIDDLDAALAALPPAEQQRAAEVGPWRRREFVAGRTALHLALGVGDAVLSDDRGAPALPPGWVGSISHKGARGAALVAPVGAGHIGVDLELAAPPRSDIARRILNEREQAALPDRGRAVTLRFAIKEAIYKALDPWVQRFVSFQEVAVRSAPGGLEAELRLSRGEGPFAVELTDAGDAAAILVAARIRRAAGR